ncbi:MAG: hypothetical protein PHS37_00305 [Candidatus Omnitrophica bacterium]|nr:hypothetical protein [Candidatus Omnitrophota bacterium]
MENLDIKEILNDKIKRAYIISVVVLAVIAWQLFLRVDVSTITALTHTRDTLNGNLDIIKNIIQTKRYIGDFDANYIVKKEQNAVIQVITELSKEANVTLDLVQPDERPFVAGRYRGLSIEVIGSGSYQAVTNFISIIENNPDYFIIAYCDLSAEDRAPEDRQVLSIEPPLPEAMPVPGRTPSRFITNPQIVQPGGADVTARRFPRKPVPPHSGRWAVFTLTVICLTAAT